MVQYFPYICCFSYLQPIGVAIQLVQQPQLLQIRSSTRSSMQPLPPAWACCQMLRVQQQPLPTTVIHRWLQQQRQLQAPTIIRTQWPSRPRRQPA